MPTQPASPRPTRAPTPAGGLVASLPYAEDILRLAPRLFESRVPVTLLGEPGVGKSSLVGLIAARAGVPDERVIEASCGAFAADVLMTELFGHEAGAFTGAQGRRAGLLEAANGGILFLDEIGEANETVQVALLAAFETGRFRRVGGTASVRSSFWLIVATNRPFDGLWDVLRPDFLGRLAGFVVTIPPLRERVGDAVKVFRQGWAAAGRSLSALAPEVEDVIRAHRWPGNVREIMRVVALVAATAPGGPLTGAQLRTALQAVAPFYSRHPESVADAPRADRLSSENAVFDCLMTHGESSMRAIVAATGMSRSTALNHLQSLRRQKRVENSGWGAGAKWRVLDEVEPVM